FQDEDDALWAGLANGIARLKNNQIKNLTPEHGLPGNTVYAIVPDDRGDFWMDTSSGILKASRQDLNEFADGKLPRIEYMLFDGLESAKVAGRSFQEPVACKTADGRIWIPNLRGLVMIDPAHLMTNRVVPPVHIEKIRIDGIEVENRQVPALRGGNGQMEFHFTALSYIAPQRMKLRYQLAGFDKEWVDADGRRSVVYDNLKPGKYSFRVQACNADGLWNTTGDTFEVELPPAFFQTTWFFAICALLGAGGIGLLYRWLAQRGEKKERKLKAANDLLDSKVRLRTAELAAANSALAVEIRAGERAEEALRAEQRLLRTMIDALPMYIACIDKNGKVVFANNLVSTFFGKPLSQIEGRHFKEVMPVEICVKQQGFIANCLAGRAEPFVHEYTLPNGAKVIGQGAFAPVSDKDGTIIGAVCGLADITERRQAEEELRGKTAFFEALVESSLDGILVVGNDRRKILQNKQAIDLWQIPASLTAGNDDAEQARFVMNMAKNPEEFLDDVNHLYAHPGVKDRREVELKNGTVLDRYSSSVIGKDGRYYGRIWMFRDITARKQMELEIEQTHQQLMAASRQAGMAEVATGVLHNVGNVLNSVNVSANLVVNALRSSRAATLAKVVQLLEQHKTDLADFITRDERGRNLPAFLASLDDHLAGERKHLVEELRSLLGNIEHINEIVAVQQANAHRVGVLESVQPSEIMETAIKMNQASYHSHEVEIIRDFEKAPPLLVDKHKVLQILINLLQNAKRACSQSRGRSGRVTVRIRPQGERGIRLEVADNGIGIPPENLTRIFSHGFTTQKDGHGFGLHSGALTAQDLGGTLVAHSDGPDEGATFILELPVQLQALAAANPGRPTPSEHSNSPSSATLIKGRPASLSPAPAGTETVRAG
ncbi:MAG: PAS domain S-box protein, partial [Limisphaerales bacterium]